MGTSVYMRMKGAGKEHKNYLNITLILTFGQQKMRLNRLSRIFA